MKSNNALGQSFEGTLEQLDAMMSNDELAAAIKYTFECCSQTYIGGSKGSDTEAGKLMNVHLRTLTDIQASRAAMFQLPHNR